MALVWPATLPWRFNRAGFTTAYADARRRVETTDGPGRLRPRMSVALRPIAGALDMSADEHARLQRFWDVDTSGGVWPFFFPDPLRHAMPLLAEPALAPLLTRADGAATLIEAWLLCQFGPEPPSPQPLAGGRLRVQLSLVVLP